MKSAIYLGKKKIEIKETPLPCLSDNDVLVKNIYSSICGTDVAVYQYGEHTGHRISVGEEFGHETISKIVAVGKDNTEFTIGERVYPLSTLRHRRYKKGWYYRRFFRIY